ncbi:Helicase ATP-binding domain-containing protein [Tumidithrix helvetica PCC 7403]|uniref:type I-D CRISPR-associated helicase Cas3' n=1 Tax=Tumidithrix helvetica TaxID=3457545 RepID=UPI003CA4B631
MSEYKITLKPVYSCPASELPKGIKLPEGWLSLSWHQVETFNALNNPDVDVVINTAMTGDGKSLAAYLKAMTGLNSTLAMYPTNELARDQERQVQNYKSQFQPKYDPQIYRLTGATLEDFVETNRLPSKQQGIIDRVNNSEILLTNPDIFHYIHDFRYLRRDRKKSNRGDNADKLFRKLDDSYKLFVFDEFHIFSSPQIASILNAMLLIKHTATKRKFLFLSATQNDLLGEFLRRSGFNIAVINPIEKGAYCFSNGEETGWRQISQPITLIFPDDLQPNPQSSYNWIVENVESIILKFFLDNPKGKGAIILNSIASVYKLLAKLKPLFEQHGLTVLTNTSLTGESERAKSIQDASLLIGTSTIDVGVDFKINFLIFEASDVSNFIQRFGRLGRHQGFSTYQAYALIPNFLVARLFTKQDNETLLLQNGEECDRISFTEAIQVAWSLKNQFECYPQRWGSIQSFSVWNELRHPRMKTIYPGADDGFKMDAQNALGFKMNQKHGQVYQYLNEKKHKIIDEARSFRGSSQLDCAIYDMTNPVDPERERFKTYNLQGLLSNFEFDLIEKNEFLQKVKQAGLPVKRFEDALCWLRLKDYREVRENWHFYYAAEDFDAIKRSGKVQILKGLEVTAGANAISQSLFRREMVCFISDHDRTYLRTKLALPMQFQAYGFSDRPDDCNPPYTIAFGQSALMLESLIWYWKPQENYVQIY